MQETPVELFAGINLAARRDVGMRQNMNGGNAVPLDNVLAQCRNGFHLHGRKIGIAAAVAGIVNFDSDG
jgi:hypothetical protein